MEQINQVHNFGISLPKEKYTCYFYLHARPKKVTGCSCMSFSWNTTVPLLKVVFSTPDEYPFQNEEDGMMLSKLITIEYEDGNKVYAKVVTFMLDPKKLEYGTVTSSV
jgi:hypothetical protein